MKVEGDILVSVCVVTYNQENYIAECLESLINQKTNFKFEIIVGEDCSTDNTRDIVKKYAEKHPDIIVLLLHEKNIGPFHNVKKVYKEAKGKYIAHMDGDDFALPGKLQKQFDILEQNKDCIICAHNMQLVDSEGNNKGKDHIFFDKGKYSKFDLYRIHALFRHSSKMFINDLFFFEKLNDVFLDIEIHTLQTDFGLIYLSDEVLGGYRENVGITFENKFISQFIRDIVEDLYRDEKLLQFNDFEKKIIKRKYSAILQEYAINCAVSIKDPKIYTHYVNESLKYGFVSWKQFVLKVFTICPKIFFKILEFRAKSN